MHGLKGNHVGTKVKVYWQLGKTYVTGKIYQLLLVLVAERELKLDFLTIYLNL